MNKGKLFMLPVPIADGVLNDTLPEHTIQTARELKFFLAENAKSARAFLKFCGHPSPIASLSIEETASLILNALELEDHSYYGTESSETSD